VRDCDSVARCVQAVQERAGRLDALVNNAGYDLYGALSDTPWEAFADQVDTNFLGAARMIQAALPGMIARGGGRIVNIGSLGGEVGLPMNGAYAASKFALRGLGESLRLELAPLGIHVSSVVPGAVATDTLDTSIREVAQVDGPLAARTAAMVRRMREDGRRSRVRPEHVARVVRRAIESAAPAARYPVGAQATWVPRMQSWLPPAVFEAIVRRLFP
jgi:NAD(P)-dependent dehydrogenase (short-subunit alcohol dehydrogenase family)